jgi:hypothetical protein
MTQKVESGDNPLAKEMDTLIHGYMRQHQIWLTVGLQSPLQLDDQLQQTVLSLGSYLFGQTPTIDAARVLATAMFLRNPYKVKFFRTVYTRVPRGADLPVEPEFMPLPEQTELFAQRMMKLKQFQFLLRPATSEGEITTDVYPISIRTVDQDPETGTLQFPHQELIEQLRHTLAAKSGTPVQKLITEQEARLHSRQQPLQSRQRETQHTGAKPTAAEASTTVPDPVSPEITPGRQHLRRRRIA